MGVKYDLLLVLFYISLMTKDVECLSTSFSKCLLKSFACFSIGFVGGCLFAVLYISELRSFVMYMYYKYFPLYVACIFIF